MAEVLTRCGYRCDLCLAYRENVMKKDERQLLHDGWKLYFGLDIPIERLVCDGCLSCSADPVLIDTSCRIRPCVTERGLEHCGQCVDYPCDIFEERRGHTREKAMKVAGQAFTQTTYKKCVLPYDNGTRIDELRADTRKIERLTNPNIVPTLETMMKFIGSPAVQWFNEIVGFLYSQTDLKVEISYGGRNYGWEVNAKKGKKPIISVTPLRGALLVLCVMGKKEIEAYEAQTQLFSEIIQGQIMATNLLHDGKWIYYRFNDEQGLRDAYALFAIKRYGKKARELRVSTGSTSEEK